MSVYKCVKNKRKQDILVQLYRIVNKNRISYRGSASPVVNLKLTNINYVALNINQKVVTRWGRWGWDKAFSNLPILGNQSQVCIQTKTRGFWLHMIHTQNRQYPTDFCYDAFSSLRYQNHELENHTKCYRKFPTTCFWHMYATTWENWLMLLL